MHFRYRSLEGRCSRSKTVGHHSCGQTPTKQEDHQEEEGRGGGSKGSQRRSAITEERDLRREHSVREQGTAGVNPNKAEWCVCVCVTRVHLLAVEEDDKFDRVDEREQRAEESPCPNHSLTVDQHQNVGGNDKLLPSQLLHQLIGQVVYQHPDTHTRVM